MSFTYLPSYTLYYPEGDPLKPIQIFHIFKQTKLDKKIGRRVFFFNCLQGLAESRSPFTQEDYVVLVLVSLFLNVEIPVKTKRLHW
jgi:hypothetical protein